MRFKLPKTNTPSMPVNRLVTLSDFIFAATMLLMVFQLDFPEKGSINSYQELLTYYLSKKSDSGIIMFLMSFVLVGVYWFKHIERYNYYKKTDQNHLYIETIYLAFLVLVPIANSLSTSFSGIVEIKLIYSLVMFALGIMAYFGWVYASKKYRLIDKDVEIKTILHIKHESLVEPFVAILAGILALVYEPLWEVCLMLIPVFFIAQKKITNKRIIKTS